MAQIAAEPYPFTFDPAALALVIIDMQRDFVDPGGFGEALGNDVSLLRKAVPPIRRLLDAARKAGVLVIHTREGHRPDLADLWPAKKSRGRFKTTIGDKGPMGRILVRGEYGHDIVEELAPKAGEPVIDKPGKGAFYATDMGEILKSRGIRQLVVCGVTTEVCVNTTVREANDRGYECLVPEDCVASYFPEFQEYALKMIKAQGGIFGWVSHSAKIVPVLEKIAAKRKTQAAKSRTTASPKAGGVTDSRRGAVPSSKRGAVSSAKGRGRIEPAPAGSIRARGQA
jgi:nicotinamidase-related amidase